MLSSLLFTRPLRHWLCAASLTVLGTAQAFEVRIDDPWVRGTVSAQKATGAFMTVTAPSTARLVSATSPVAGVVEIHEMVMQDNVMRMRAIKGLDLPAGQPVALKPGGYHIMLMNLKQPLKTGETVPVTLTLEEGGRSHTQTVQAMVRPLGGGHSGGGGHHHHGGMH